MVGLCEYEDRIVSEDECGIVSEGECDGGIVRMGV